MEKNALLNATELEKKLGEASFNENYRILETNFGLETKEDFIKSVDRHITKPDLIYLEM
jgi:hypothetical protein